MVLRLLYGLWPPEFAQEAKTITSIQGLNLGGVVAVKGKAHVSLYFCLLSTKSDQNTKTNNALVLLSGLSINKKNIKYNTNIFLPPPPLQISPVSFFTHNCSSLRLIRCQFICHSNCVHHTITVSLFLFKLVNFFQFIFWYSIHFIINKLETIPYHLLVYLFFFSLFCFF